MEQANKKNTCTEKLFKLTRKNPIKDTEAYKYKYAKLDQVIAIVDVMCDECELQWRQGVYRYDKDDYSLITRIFDGNSEMILDERPFVQFPEPRQQGSWETYIRRYALMCAFGLVAIDDDGAAVQPLPQEGTKRDKMIIRIMDLTNACIEQGVKTTSFKEYMQAYFNTTALKDLNEEQLAKYGKHLATLAEDTKELK